VARSARRGCFVGPPLGLIREPFLWMMRRLGCDLIGTMTVEAGFSASILGNANMLGAGSHGRGLAAEPPKRNEHTQHGYH